MNIHFRPTRAELLINNLPHREEPSGQGRRGSAVLATPERIVCLRGSPSAWLPLPKTPRVLLKLSARVRRCGRSPAAWADACTVPTPVLGGPAPRVGTESGFIRSFIRVLDDEDALDAGMVVPAFPARTSPFRG